MVDLSIKDANATGGACNCGCGGHGAKAEQAAPATGLGAVVADYTVSGMTCGHCVSAVTEEVSAIPGVTDVTVDLKPGATSTVQVTSTAGVTGEQIAAALDEAGDYHLAATD